MNKEDVAKLQKALENLVVAIQNEGKAVEGTIDTLTSAARLDGATVERVVEELNEVAGRLHEAAIFLRDVPAAIADR